MKKRLLSLFMIACMLFTQFPCYAYADEETDRICQTYMVSDMSTSRFVADFLIHEGKVYISADSLARLGVTEDIVIGSDGIPFCLVYGEKECMIPEEYILEKESGRYYLFEQVMDRLDCSTYFSEENRQVLVHKCRDLSGIRTIAADVYSSKQYNLRYWQDSDLYAFSKYGAILTDITKNSKYVDYLTGAAQEELYEEAVWSILIPSDEEESIDFLDETSETLDVLDTGIGFMDKTKNLDDVLSELLEVDGYFQGDWGDVAETFVIANDVVDKLEFSEIISALKYMEGMKTMEESYLNGLENVLDLYEGSGDDDQTWYRAASQVDSLCRDSDPVWKTIVHEFFEGVQEDVMGDITDWLIENGISKLTSAAIKVESRLLDLTLGTQEKVDAVLLAQACLDIQKKCRFYKNQYIGWIGDIASIYGYPDEEQIETAKNLRDVTCLYLRCGLAACKALAIDPEMEYCYQVNAEAINEQLKALLSYKEEDFTYTQANQTAAENLANYLNGLSDEEVNVAALPSEIDLPEGWNGAVKITWTNTTGEAPCSFSFWLENNEISSEEYEEQGGEEALWEIGFYDPVDITRIEIEEDVDDPMDLNQYWGFSEFQMECYNANGECFYSGDPQEFKTRWATGVWTCCIEINWASETVGFAENFGVNGDGSV